jgi:hypothetical protein
MLSEAGNSKCYHLTIYKGILFARLPYMSRILSPRKPNEIFKEINCVSGKKWPFIKQIKHTPKYIL